jgi:hypothetical protein
MSTNNTVFHSFYAYRASQVEQRNSHYATLIQPVVTPATLEDPSQSRTRPRHHFRRGAISASSGRSIFPVTNPAQVLTQQETRIRAVTYNQIAVPILPTAYSQQYNRQHTIPSASSTQWHSRTELADRIHRALVNMSTDMTMSISSLQQQLNIVVAPLEDPTTPLATATADNDAADQPRDTRRFGREGWWTAEDQPATNQRPSTIPGSNFVVPDSTLYLFQSVDLFAPPPAPEARMTVRDVRAALLTQIRHHIEEFEFIFHRLLAFRRTGRHILSGQIFLVSLELSRLRQVLQIVMEEGVTYTIRRDAMRREREDQDQDAGMTESVANDNGSPDVPSDNDSSTAGPDEPEGWINLPSVLDGDLPQEVSFRIGFRRVTFPIEAVEEWIVNERRRQRRANNPGQRPRAPYAPGSAQRPPLGGEVERRRVLHTLALPEASSGRWRSVSDWAGPRDDTYVDYEIASQEETDAMLERIMGEDEEEEEEEEDVDDETQYETEREARRLVDWDTRGVFEEDAEDEEEGEEEGEEEAEEDAEEEGGEDDEEDGEKGGEEDDGEDGEEEGEEEGDDNGEDLDEQ